MFLLFQSQLGEGGYAYVDLVRGEQQALYAMKTVRL